MLQTPFRTNWNAGTFSKVIWSLFPNIQAVWKHNLTLCRLSDYTITCDSWSSGIHQARPAHHQLWTDRYRNEIGHSWSSSPLCLIMEPSGCKNPLRAHPVPDSQLHQFTYFISSIFKEATRTQRGQIIFSQLQMNCVQFSDSKVSPWQRIFMVTYKWFT